MGSTFYFIPAVLAGTGPHLWGAQFSPHLREVGPFSSAAHQEGHHVFEQF